MEKMPTVRVVRHAYALWAKLYVKALVRQTVLSWRHHPHALTHAL